MPVFGVLKLLVTAKLIKESRRSKWVSLEAIGLVSHKKPYVLTKLDI